MAVTISGKLINGIGEPIKNCKITLKSISTSTTVIAHTTASQIPSATGDYSLSVEPGKYKVTLGVEGFPPEYVGDIQVYKDSPNGTLNYFLGLPLDGDLRPDVIKQFEAMVDKVASQVAEVEKSKLAAEGSARSAAASADRASQITGLSTVTDAISMASVPLPDVWIPFNDSLQMLTGYGEEVKVGAVTVAKMVSFSRATTATYIDKSGALCTAEINEPRFDKDGPLTEGQSTNLCTHSKVTLSGWTANATPGIEVGDFYTKIKPSASGSGYYIATGERLIVGETYTLSFWAYSVLDSAAVRIGSEKENKMINDISNKPTRYELTFKATQTSPVIVAYGGYNVRDFYIGGVQLEKLPFATSLIPTSGTQVTRLPDKCWIQQSRNSNNKNGVQTVVFEFDIMALTDSARVVDFDNSGGADRNRISVSLDSSSNNITGVYLGVGASGPGNQTSNITISPAKKLSGVIACVFYGDGFKIYLNGVGGDRASSNSAFESKNNRIVFLNSNLFNYSNSFGHIRNFRIWHHALTDEQIKALK